MAIRYFDANGTTAGFGTLTGNWNSTGPTVGWSSSAAGTGAVGAYTFTNIDEAVFGVAGVSATGGTVTVPDGVNVTLNKITTANISGQTISYAGTGKITFAGTNPTINDNSPLTISVPLAGTNGVTKIGTANPLRIKVPGTISGTYAQTSGLHTWVGAEPSASPGPTANVFPNITDFNIQAGIFYIWNSNNSGYTYNGPFRGAGTVLLTQANTTTAASNTIAFPSLQDWTGTFVLWSNSTTANRYAFASVAIFPTSGAADLRYLHEEFGGAVNGIEKRLIVPNGASGHTTPAKITVYTAANQPVSSAVYRLDANQASTDSNGMTFSGPVQRIDGGTGYSNIGTLTLTLGGTNTDSNTISGLVSSAAGMGVLAIGKADAGLWVLSNANTYTGGTALSGGTLRGSNSAAFGTNNITMSTSTVLELAGGINLTNGINSVGTIRSVSGSNTVAAASATPLVLGGTTTFEAAAGATLVVSPASPITGTAAVVLGGAGTVTASQQFSQATTLTKNGSGTATVSNTSNAFASGATITDGVLAVPDLAALGTGTSLTLSGGGVLRYTGSSGGTLSRTLSGTSLTGGFENTGNGNLVVGGSGSLAGTIKLGSASDGTGQYNTLAATVSSGGFTKQGLGRWISTAGNNLAGSTTVSAGTLMGANANGATSKLLGGAVTVYGGAKIQTGSDNGQLGKNRYSSLSFAGTPGNPARIRIGGSAVNPTVQIAGVLTIPAGGTTWDISADTFKSKGVYTLVEFGPSGSLSGDLSNVELTKPVGFESRIYELAYNIGASPKTITVTIS